MTRRRWFLVAGAVLVVAALAHYLWWYSPRVRPATPDPDDLPGQLLASGALPVALWVAYPHQNLGALEEGFGEGAERRHFLEALARVADLPEPALPGFGPFAAPPAREMVALSDEAGERVVVVARVYPALAAISRLAGKLAGNPWLAGGEVEAFGGWAQVSWDGTLWTVGNVDVAELLPKGRGGGENGRAGSEEFGDAPPALAALRLDRPISYLPAGTHRLRRTDDGLALGSDEASETGGTTAAGEGDPEVFRALDRAGSESGGDLALLAVSGPGGPLEGEGGAFALFSGSSGGGGLMGLLGDLPSAAVWYRPGGERFDLPGEKLLSRLGGSRARTASGWSLLGTGSSAVAAAEPLTPEVDRLTATASLALVTDPTAALAAVDRVLAILEAVPLVSSDEVRKWRDWHAVLAPLTAYHGVMLETTPPADASRSKDGGGTVRLILGRREG